MSQEEMLADERIVADVNSAGVGMSNRVTRDAGLEEVETNSSLDHEPEEGNSPRTETSLKLETKFEERMSGLR